MRLKDNTNPFIHVNPPYTAYNGKCRKDALPMKF